ncbi:MAG: serine/threonine-protein kinase RsbW [Solirubrobacteraceae bacterium]|nr:serine/threonine-protein kinase RsbW [Solirubrobacteraceae bacterium]
MTLELDLPRELDSAAAARHAVDQLAENMPEDQLGDVRLLVSELVTNSLRHAELDPDDHIRLAVTVDDHRVRVEVADPGKGFEVSLPADDPDTVEGWGLYLVATLSDRWGVDQDSSSGATRVWFELDRTPESGLQAA